METIEMRIRQLRELVSRHNHLYYVENKPEISDTAFDAIFRKLVELENEYPEFTDPNSPIVRVGSDTKNKFPKAAHPFPMLSVKSFYEHNPIAAAIPSKGPFWVTPKYDGIAIEIQYRFNTAQSFFELEKAVTRGDGYTGETVTDNIRTIMQVPLIISSIKGATGDTLILRGEIYITSAQLKQYNKIRRRNKMPPCKNLRSTAASLVKAHKSAETAQAALNAVFFFAALSNSNGFAQLPILREGVIPEVNIPQVTICQTADQAIAEAEKTAVPNHPFPCDGAVISAAEITIPEKGRDYAGIWAYKPSAEIWQTTLMFVSFEVSKNGKITPVGFFESFMSQGSRFAKASFATIENLQKLQPHNGGAVHVQITGGIIPEVIKAFPGNSPVTIPDVCPACHQPLMGDKCTNNSWCPARGYDLETVQKHVNLPVSYEIDPLCYYGGISIIRHACMGYNAIVVKKPRTQSWVILAENITTLANVAVAIGRNSPAPHTFETLTTKEILQSAKQRIAELEDFHGKFSLNRK